MRDGGAGQAKSKKTLSYVYLKATEGRCAGPPITTPRHPSADTTATNIRPALPPAAVRPAPFPRMEVVRGVRPMALPEQQAGPAVDRTAVVATTLVDITGPGPEARRPAAPSSLPTFSIATDGNEGAPEDLRDILLGHCEPLDAVALL